MRDYGSDHDMLLLTLLPTMDESEELPTHNYGDNCPKCLGGLCTMAPFVNVDPNPASDYKIESYNIHEQIMPHRLESVPITKKCKSCGGFIDSEYIHKCPTLH